jgi:hypothetical protein
MHNSTFVPSSSREPSSTPKIFTITPILVSSSSYDEKEDENTPPPTQPPLVESIEHEPAPTL